MSGKINFILGVHNHLPNGSAEDEFETLYNHKIRPLISALYQFPRINVVIHYTGVLLHWIERRHPELFVLIDDLLSRKQAELLGGGFYEPMMPLLPLADKIGQIEMLTTYLRRQFGRRPLGCWLPGLSWEQNLVGPLNACGMGYTFLNESCFRAAGADLKGGYFYEPCITEDQGKIITVFPLSVSLEERPSLILEKLGSYRGMNSESEGPVTIFPDFVLKPGEKAETGFQLFFEELSAADSCIEFTTPGRILRNFHCLKKMYFTGCSAEQASPRQFMTEYPEAGGIYSKMIHTRVYINQLRGDKARKLSALEELWKAQDSAIFSPMIGNPHVRKAAYKALLEAEKITREKGSFSPSLSAFDYDLDGEDEYVFQDEKLNCYIRARGAGLFELDYLPKSWNFLDTFANGKNSGSGGVRSAFSDYLVPGKNLPVLDWRGVENARFCGNEIFETVELDRVRRELKFRLLPGKDLQSCNIGIYKTWRLQRNTLSLQYRLENVGPGTEHFFLIPSVDFSFSGAGEPHVRFLAIRKTGREPVEIADQKQTETVNINGFEIRDIKNETVMIMEADRNFNANLFNAANLTNPGIPEYYQFTCIMPVFPVSLDSGKNQDIVFSIKISS